jgi:hypothetical protein
MNSLIEKVITTSTIGDGTDRGGLLPPEQTNTFIDYIFDATVLGNQVRKMRVNTDTTYVNRIGVGERLARLATEAVDDHANAGVAFTKVSLTTEKLRLDWELSSESLEDNLEGEALEDHVARLMTAQLANDLEDVAINGNVMNTTDPLFKAFDGWRKQLHAGASVIDNGGKILDRGTFNKALRTMPRRYMARRGNLRFYSVAGLIQDYLFDAVLADTGTYQRTAAQADAANARSNVAEGGAGWTPAAPFGVSLQEVPLFPEYAVSGGGSDAGNVGSDLWLVDPQNLIWAIKREIQVYREFKPKKDTVEYTVYTRVGCAVENSAAAVVVKNVAYKA